MIEQTTATDQSKDDKIPNVVIHEQSKDPKAIDNTEKHHILIVENNIELLDFLKNSLSEYFKISSAKNGIDGSQKTNSIQPDLIISDVMIPEMDGIEFCKK